MPSDWPGNVRELENLVARRLALGGVRTSLRGTEKTGPIVDPIEAVLAQDLSFPEARERVQAEFERRYVERILAAHGGNVARAAAASGIARRYFQIIKARQKG
jgi:DNA-binding NtrC family response regulator